MSNTQRFVSLYGFFAFNFPNHWSNETDEAGHYIFYNNNGGQGVLRIMLLPNEFEGEDAAAKMLQEVYEQNRSCEPSLYAAGTNRFVHFAKEHEVSGSWFTVYYWATAKYDKVVLFTYTIQSAMKNLPIAEQEKQDIESMVAALEFLSGEGHQH